MLLVLLQSVRVITVLTLPISNFAIPPLVLSAGERTTTTCCKKSKSWYVTLLPRALLAYMFCVSLYVCWRVPLETYFRTAAHFWVCYTATEGLASLHVLCFFVCLLAGSLGNLLSNGGSFLGVLSKAFCALQTHLKFLHCSLGEEEVSTCCLVPLVDGCSHLLLNSTRVSI